MRTSKLEGGADEPIDGFDTHRGEKSPQQPQQQPASELGPVAPDANPGSASAWKCRNDVVVQQGSGGAEVGAAEGRPERL